MLITVAICTLNRAESLRRTLESLAAMRLPDDLEWEVVVVNNNCTDHTDAVIEAFAARLPIRRELEPQRGLSRARNRAVDAARGDYIVWTDDDVIVDAGWLPAYTEAFRRWPEGAVFGGPIVPRYTTPVARWIVGNEALLSEMAFSARDLGNETMALSAADGRIPFGPNFAVRAAEQRIFLYDPLLGHAPGQHRRAEETEVVEQILGSQACGYWVPHARVEHCVTRQQQTARYVVACYMSVGEADAFRKSIPAPPGSKLWFGIPRWVWRDLAERWLRFRVHRMVSPPRIWLQYLRVYALHRGHIRYWRSQGGPVAGR